MYALPSYEKGEKFVVEMQKNEQHFFKDRTIYYATFPIRDQAKKPFYKKLKFIYREFKTPHSIRTEKKEEK